MATAFIHGLSMHDDGTWDQRCVAKMVPMTGEPIGIGKSSTAVLAFDYDPFCGVGAGRKSRQWSFDLVAVS